MIRVLALAGSLRSPSYTSDLLRLAIKDLEACGVYVHFLDLRALALPHCSGIDHYEGYPGVAVLRRAFAEAHAFFLVTPEYHGSISGVLKNALDLVSEEEIAGKVVALAAVVGGHHSTNALNTLRVIFRQLHAWVVPEQLVISHADNAFDVNKQLSDPLLRERLQQLTARLIDATERLGISRVY